MASRSLNKVMLIGNLTRDPELRYTPSGTAVCNFGLATNRSWTASDSNEKQEETEFHRIVAWQKLAELCAQLLFKGRKVYVEGRIQTRKWTAQDGQERSTTEVVIDNMIVLDSRRKPDQEDEDEQVSGPDAQKSADTRSSAAGQSQAKKDPGKTAKDEKGKTETEETDADKPAEPMAKDAKSSGSKSGSEQSADSNEENEEVKADDIPF
jgi:single-strand DNA-binding protein